MVSLTYKGKGFETIKLYTKEDAETLTMNLSNHSIIIILHVEILITRCTTLKGSFS